jgi:3-hydroxyacyl-[acyl-carrier-protein] dehydratase
LAGKDLLVDLSQIDLNHVLADLEEIRRFNPQRHEMEQLTAIVHENLEDHSCVGYKEVTDREFWVRGHMPSMPLMPGVVMLESAAQLCSYFTQKHDLLGAKVVGFGGLEDVRFRDPVVPGDRLYVLCKLQKVRKGRIVISQFQGVVRENVVVEGIIKGVPLPVDALGSAP